MTSTAGTRPEPTGSSHDNLFVASLLREATLQLTRSDYEGAEQTLSRALALAPQHPGSLACLALCQAEGRRKFVTAEKLARRAVRLAPQFAGGYDALGRIYLLACRWEDARHCLEKAHALAPADFQIKERLTSLRRDTAPVCRFLSFHHPVNQLLARARSFLGQDHHLALMTGLVLTLGVWMGLILYGQNIDRRESESHHLALRASQARQVVQAVHVDPDVGLSN
jgi:tetratricopeptide (TPR) repeat protein